MVSLRAPRPVRVKSLWRRRRRRWGERRGGGSDKERQAGGAGGGGRSRLSCGSHSFSISCFLCSAVLPPKPPHFTHDFSFNGEDGPQSRVAVNYGCVVRSDSTQLHRWQVNRYKFSFTVHFQVLCTCIYLSENFCTFTLLHFKHKYLYFLLLTFPYPSAKHVLKYTHTLHIYMYSTMQYI